MFQTYKGEIALLIGTFLASVGWFFSKFAIVDFPPVMFVAIRFLLAGAIFLPFAYQQMRKLTLQQFAMAGAVGLFFAGNLITWILAVKQSENLGEGAFIMSLSMLITPLIAWLIFQNKPNGLFWLALPIAILGLYFLVAGQGKLGLTQGSSLFLLAAASSAIYFVLVNQFAKQLPPFVLTTIMLTIVGIICAIYSLLTENWQITVQTQTWWWLAASILIATNLRFFIQTWGQRYCHISNSAIIMLLEPIWTLWISVLLLGEAMSWQKSVGCVLIFVSLIVYRLPMIIKRKKA